MRTLAIIAITMLVVTGCVFVDASPVVKGMQALEGTERNECSGYAGVEYLVLGRDGSFMSFGCTDDVDVLVEPVHVSDAFTSIQCKVYVVYHPDSFGAYCD